MESERNRNLTTLLTPRSSVFFFHYVPWPVTRLKFLSMQYQKKQPLFHCLIFFRSGIASYRNVNNKKKTSKGYIFFQQELFQQAIIV